MLVGRVGDHLVIIDYDEEFFRLDGKEIKAAAKAVDI
jgi:hypothetical protein